MHQNLGETCSKKVEAEDSAGRDKGKEVPVIAPAYTIVEPDAMVVLRFDAVVAYSAMVTPCWAPDIASFAVFSRNFHCCCS